MAFKKGLNGIWRIIPSPAITEIIAQSGFDFQILDCEHGAYDFQTLENDIRVCELRNCLPYVRVSGLNNVEVQRCLDLGASGIVFPQLITYEHFKTAVSLLNYAPKGVRGFNPFVRAWNYGVSEEKLKKPFCITIVETLQAVNDLDNILALEGIDCIYIGSYDLSAQLGCIGEMDNPRLSNMVNSIISKCKNASVSVGLMVSNTEQYKKYNEVGVDFFVHTVDSHKLKQMFTSVIYQAKP